MIIFGKIKEGQIIVQRFFRDEVKRMEGKQVEIKSLLNSRSQQQNRYMWGIVYKIIGDELGMTSEEVHEVYKEKFLSYKKEIKGKFYTFTKSTTELNVVEFGEYLDKVIRHASSELGLIIPEPDSEFEYGD